MADMAIAKDMTGPNLLPRMRGGRYGPDHISENYNLHIL